MRDLGPEDLSEIYELRIMLETRCIRHALENLTDDDVPYLVELSEREGAKTFDRDGMAFRREFYDQLYARADRPYIHRLITQLRDNTQRYHLLWRGDEHKPYPDLRPAVRDRDGDLGAKLVEQHLEAARDDLLRIRHTDAGEVIR